MVAECKVTIFYMSKHGGKDSAGNVTLAAKIQRLGDRHFVHQTLRGHQEKCL